MPEPVPTPDQRLAEIRAREQAATEGPWIRWHDQETIPNWDGFIVIGDDAAEGEECNPVAKIYTEDDAEFAAHAREDVPWLLAYAEGAVSAGCAQQQRIAELETELKQAQATLGRVRAEAQSMLENGCKALEESAWARHAAEQRAEQAERERDGDGSR